MNQLAPTGAAAKCQLCDALVEVPDQPVGAELCNSCAVYLDAKFGEPVRGAPQTGKVAPMPTAREIADEIVRDGMERMPWSHERFAEDIERAILRHSEAAMVERNSLRDALSQIKKVLLETNSQSAVAAMIIATCDSALSPRIVWAIAGKR